jgi:glycosyltransferase involved in cell wall biosynthesis
MNKPLVSIVIPVYNGANYLGEAIDSALAQTYKNCEVIVVNDGSNDNGATEKICLSYGNKIRYFSKENGGVATAINRGIKEMKGEYFAWLSHDDVYYPQKIEKQISALEMHGDLKAVVHCNYDVLFMKTKVLAHHEYLSTYTEQELTNSNFGAVFLCLHGCSILVHKSHFERIGLYDEKLKTTQDSVFLFFALRGQRSVFVKDQLFIARLHKKQGNRTMRSHRRDFNQMMIGFCKELSDKEKENLCGSVYSFYFRLYTLLLLHPKAGFCLKYLHAILMRYPHGDQVTHIPPSGRILRIMFYGLRKTWRFFRTGSTRVYRGLSGIKGKCSNLKYVITWIFRSIVRVLRTTIKIILGAFYSLPYILDRKTEYIASVFSIGDTLLIGGLMKAYKIRHPEKNIRMIIKKSHQQLIELFRDDIGNPVYVSPFAAKIIRVFFNVAGRNSSRIIFGLPDNTLYKYDRNVVMRLKIMGLLNCYKRVLRLPVTAQYAFPVFPTPEKNKLSEICQKYSITPNKTVILAPYAITLEMYNYEPIFGKIANHLKENGYRVLTNTLDGHIIPGTSAINADFIDIVIAAQCAGWVISLRSGLCDLLQFSGCKLTVLYPTEYHREIFSIEKSFGKNRNINEIIVSAESTQLQDIFTICQDDNGLIDIA